MLYGAHRVGSAGLQPALEPPNLTTIASCNTPCSSSADPKVVRNLECQTIFCRKVFHAKASCKICFYSVADGERELNSGRLCSMLGSCVLATSHIRGGSIRMFRLPLARLTGFLCKHWPISAEALHKSNKMLLRHEWLALLHLACAKCSSCHLRAMANRHATMRKHQCGSAHGLLIASKELTTGSINTVAEGVPIGRRHAILPGACPASETEG